jgi:hypothetical protein
MNLNTRAKTAKICSYMNGSGLAPSKIDDFSIENNQQKMEV